MVNNFRPGVMERLGFGYAVAKDHVSVHDLHATMLRQLGINHELLAYRFQGLDFRLTGVEKARVVKEVLA